MISNMLYGLGGPSTGWLSSWEDRRQRSRRHTWRALSGMYPWSCLLTACLVWSPCIIQAGLSPQATDYVAVLMLCTPHCSYLLCGYLYVFIYYVVWKCCIILCHVQQSSQLVPYLSIPSHGLQSMS
uniref:Uncharacterized protein n=1 Tax=Myotis myotis TaxID=51298 RepID=A0A7J7VYW4_MYOMY|nr:hypothetical protein mMyoMyo1_012192 [Myotis myotis]